MFADVHDNPPSLRQGDIISDVFFPLSRPASLKYLGTYGSGSGTNVKLETHVEKPVGSIKQYVQAITHGLVSHAAVVNQCCDLDKKHPKTSLSVCRLIPLDRARYRNLETLINNIDPWGPENPHFQFFYLGAIGGLEGEHLADFGVLTTLGWSDYDFLLGKKVHQLDAVSRNKFRVKVSAYLGRPTQEDLEAGLSNPYMPPVPPLPAPPPDV